MNKGSLLDNKIKFLKQNKYQADEVFLIRINEGHTSESARDLIERARKFLGFSKKTSPVDIYRSLQNTYKAMT